MSILKYLGANWDLLNPANINLSTDAPSPMTSFELLIGNDTKTIIAVGYPRSSNSEIHFYNRIPGVPGIWDAPIAPIILNMNNIGTSNAYLEDLFYTNINGQNYLIVTTSYVTGMFKFDTNSNSFQPLNSSNLLRVNAQQSLYGTFANKSYLVTLDYTLGIKFHEYVNNSWRTIASLSITNGFYYDMTYVPQIGNNLAQLIVSTSANKMEVYHVSASVFVNNGLTFIAGGTSPGGMIYTKIGADDYLIIPLDNRVSGGQKIEFYKFTGTAWVNDSQYDFSITTPNAPEENDIAKQIVYNNSYIRPMGIVFSNNLAGQQVLGVTFAFPVNGQTNPTLKKPGVYFFGQPAPVISPPTIPPSGQPQSQTVTAPNPATFSVTPSGTGPFTYQWSKNGALIPGATNPSYTTPNTTTGDSGSTFTVTVTNAGGSVTSNPATLTVNPAQPGPCSLSITKQPSTNGALSLQFTGQNVPANQTISVDVQRNDPSQHRTRFGISSNALPYNYKSLDTPTPSSYNVTINLPNCSSDNKSFPQPY